MQRYHMMVWRDDVAEPVEHIDGEWVRYSDAEAELARLRAENEKLQARPAGDGINRIIPTHDQIGGPMPDSAGWRYTEHWGDVWPW